MHASRVIADACLMFHWQPDYALKMPAVRFFALVREAHRIREMDHVALLSDMCDVASIALGDAKYYTSLKQAYRDRMKSIVGNIPSLPQAKPNKAEPIPAESMKAKNALMGIFSSAKGMR